MSEYIIDLGVNIDLAAISRILKKYNGEIDVDVDLDLKDAGKAIKKLESQFKGLSSVDSDFGDNILRMLAKSTTLIDSMISQINGVDAASNSIDFNNAVSDLREMSSLITRIVSESGKLKTSVGFGKDFKTSDLSKDQKESLKKSLESVVTSHYGLDEEEALNRFTGNKRSAQRVFNNSDHTKDENALYIDAIKNAFDSKDDELKTKITSAFNSWQSEVLGVTHNVESAINGIDLSGLSSIFGELNKLPQALQTVATKIENIRAEAVSAANGVGNSVSSAVDSVGTSSIDKANGYLEAAKKQFSRVKKEESLLKKMVEGTGYASGDKKNGFQNAYRAFKDDPSEDNAARLVYAIEDAATEAKILGGGNSFLKGVADGIDRDAAQIESAGERAGNAAKEAASKVDAAEATDSPLDGVAEKTEDDARRIEDAVDKAEKASKKAGKGKTKSKTSDVSSDTGSDSQTDATKKSGTSTVKPDGKTIDIDVSSLNGAADKLGGAAGSLSGAADSLNNAAALINGAFSGKGVVSQPQQKSFAGSEANADDIRVADDESNKSDGGNKPVSKYASSRKDFKDDQENWGEHAARGYRAYKKVADSAEQWSRNVLESHEGVEGGARRLSIAEADISQSPIRLTKEDFDLLFAYNEAMDYLNRLGKGDTSSRAPIEGNYFFEHASQDVRDIYRSSNSDSSKMSLARAASTEELWKEFERRHNAGYTFEDLYRLSKQNDQTAFNKAVETITANGGFQSLRSDMIPQMNAKGKIVGWQYDFGSADQSGKSLSTRLLEMAHDKTRFKSIDHLAQVAEEARKKFNQASSKRETDEKTIERLTGKSIGDWDSGGYEENYKKSDMYRSLSKEDKSSLTKAINRRNSIDALEKEWRDADRKLGDAVQRRRTQIISDLNDNEIVRHRVNSNFTGATARQLANFNDYTKGNSRRTDGLLGGELFSPGSTWQRLWAEQWVTDSPRGYYNRDVKDLNSQISQSKARIKELQELKKNGEKSVDGIDIDSLIAKENERLYGSKLSDVEKLDLANAKRTVQETAEALSLKNIGNLSLEEIGNLQRDFERASGVVQTLEEKSKNKGLIAIRDEAKGEAADRRSKHGVDGGWQFVPSPEVASRELQRITVTPIENKDRIEEDKDRTAKGLDYAIKTLKDLPTLVEGSDAAKEKKKALEDETGVAKKGLEEANRELEKRQGALVGFYESHSKEFDPRGVDYDAEVMEKAKAIGLDSLIEERKGLVENLNDTDNKMAENARQSELAAKAISDLEKNNEQDKDDPLYKQLHQELEQKSKALDVERQSLMSERSNIESAIRTNELQQMGAIKIAEHELGKSSDDNAVKTAKEFEALVKSVDEASDNVVAAKENVDQAVAKETDYADKIKSSGMRKDYMETVFDNLRTQAEQSIEAAFKKGLISESQANEFRERLSEITDYGTAQKPQESKSHSASRRSQNQDSIDDLKALGLTDDDIKSVIVDLDTSHAQSQLQGLEQQAEQTEQAVDSIDDKPVAFKESKDKKSDKSDADSTFRKSDDNDGKGSSSKKPKERSSDYSFKDALKSIVDIDENGNLSVADNAIKNISESMKQLGLSDGSIDQITSKIKEMCTNITRASVLMDDNGTLKLTVEGENEVGNAIRLIANLDNESDEANPVKVRIDIDNLKGAEKEITNLKAALKKVTDERIRLIRAEASGNGANAEEIRQRLQEKEEELDRLKSKSRDSWSDDQKKNFDKYERSEDARIRNERTKRIDAAMNKEDKRLEKSRTDVKNAKVKQLIDSEKELNKEMLTMLKSDAGSTAFEEAYKNAVKLREEIERLKRELGNVSSQQKGLLNDKQHRDYVSALEDGNRKLEEQADLIRSNAQKIKDGQSRHGDTWKNHHDLSRKYKQLEGSDDRTRKAMTDYAHDYHALSEAIEEYDDCVKRYGKNSSKAVEACEKMVDAQNKLKKSYGDAKRAISVDTGRQKDIAESEKLIQQQQSLILKMEAWKKTSSKVFNSQTADARALVDEYERLEAAIRDCTNLSDLRDLNVGFGDLKNKVKAAGLEGESMSEKLRNKFKEYGQYAVASFGVMEIAQGLRYMAQEVLAVDTAMTGLQRVAEMTPSKTAEMFDKMTVSAKEYGRTLTDTIDATADWVRAGFDEDTALGLAQVTAMYQNVSDLDYAEASENLLTSYKGFQDELLANTEGDSVAAATHITDVLNELDNQFSVTSAGLGEGLARSASALQVAGNTFEESAAMIGAVAEVTQDPEKAGNAMKILSLRLRGMKGDLEEIEAGSSEGVESISKMQTQILNMTGGHVNIFDENGDFKSTYEIMQGIVEVWDTLSSIDQADLLETIAGKHRANDVAALIENWGNAEAMAETGLNSAGSAAKENERTVNSLQGRINSLTATWQDFCNTVMNSDFLKGLVSAGGTLLDLFTKIIDTVGTLPTLLGMAAAAMSFTQFKGMLPFSVEKDRRVSVGDQLRIFGKDKTEIKALKQSLSSDKSLATILGAPKVDVRNNIGNISTSTLSKYTSDLKALDAVANTTKTSLKGMSVELKEILRSGEGFVNKSGQITAAGKAAIKSGEIQNRLEKNLNAKEAATKATSGSWKEMSTAINHFNQADDKGKAKMIDNLKKMDAAAASYFQKYESGAKAGQTSTIGLARAMTTAKIATVGLQIAATAASMALTMGLAFAIGKLVEGAMWLQKTFLPTAKQTAEAVEEIMGEFEELNDKAKDAKKVAQEVGKEYVELSKGVNSLTNENKNLSTEEYERYLDVANQIGEAMPSLVRGYDEQGNAILTCQGNVEGLTQAYKDMQKAANDAIIGDAGTIFKDFKNDMKKAAGQNWKDWGVFAWMDDDIDLESYGQLSEWSADLTAANFESLESLNEMANATEAAFTAIGTAAGAVIGGTFGLGVGAVPGSVVGGVAGFAAGNIVGNMLPYLSEDYDNLDEIAKAYESLGHVRKEYLGGLAKEDDLSFIRRITETDPSAMQKIMKQYEDSLEPLAAELRTVTEAHISNAFLSGDYDEISDSMESMITQMIPNLSTDFFKGFIDEDGNFDSIAFYDKLNSIMDIFNNLSPQQEKRFELFVDMQSRYNNGEISVNEYLAEVDKVESMISGLDPEVQKSIKIVLGIEENTVEVDKKALMDDLENELDMAHDAAEHFVGNMSSGKLRIMYDLVLEAKDNIALEGEIDKSMIDEYEAELNEALSKGIDLSRTVYGNIDMDNRQAIEWDAESLFQWKDELMSWEPDGSVWDDVKAGYDGFVSTVLGTYSSYSYGDGKEIEIAFSPMLQTNDGAEILSKGTVDEYINTLISEATDESGNLDSAKLMALDVTGLEVDGKKISNILAGVGKDAALAAEAMHYVGEEGSIAMTELMKIADREFKVNAALEYTIDMSAEGAEMESFNVLKTAMAETVSGSGLTAESISKLKSRYSELASAGYDLSKVFDVSSNGIRLNRQELAKLEVAYSKQKFDETAEHVKVLKEEYDRLNKTISDPTATAQERANASMRQNNIVDQINSLGMLMAQYDGLSSAYNRWRSLEESGQERDMYETIIEGLGTLDDETGRGWIDDGSIALLETLTGRTDLAAASATTLKGVYDQLDDAINSAGYSIRDFFTVDDEGNSTNKGVYNFLRTVEALESSDQLNAEGVAFKDMEGIENLIQKDSEGKIIGFDFKVAGGDEAVAEALGVGEELVQIMLRAADDAGFVVNIEGAYTAWADLETAAQEAVDRINETFEGIDININANGKDFAEEYAKADAVLKKYQNSDRTINEAYINEDESLVQEAQDALDVMSYLVAKKDDLEEPAYMNLEASDVEKELQEPLSQAQLFQDFLRQKHQLEIAGADTSAIKADMMKIADYFAGLPNHIKDSFDIEGLDVNQIYDKLETGQLQIPTALDLQVEMNEDLDMLVKTALYEAGLMSASQEEAYKEEISVYLEPEVESPTLGEEISDAVDGAVERANNTKAIADVDVDAGNVDVSSVCDTVNDTVDSAIETADVETTANVDVEAGDVDASNVGDIVSDTVEEAVQENGSVKATANVGVDNVKVDSSNLEGDMQKNLEARTNALQEYADMANKIASIGDVESNLTANVHGNVTEKSLNEISSLKAFSESAQNVGSIGYAYAEVDAKIANATDANSVIYIKEDNLKKLKTFADSAKEVGSIGYAYAEVDAKVANSTDANSAVNISSDKLNNLKVFTDSAKDIKSIGFAQAEVIAKVHGSVLETGEHKLNNLKVFTDSAKDIKSIGFAQAEVIADVDGNVIGTGEAVLERLKVFTDSAKDVDSIGFAYSEVIADVSGNVIGTGETPLGRLKVFTDSAKDVDSIGFAYAEVQADVSGNVIEKDQYYLERLKVFTDSAKDVDSIGFAYSEVQADVSGNVTNTGETLLERLKVFADSAKDVGSIGYAYAEVDASISNLNSDNSVLGVSDENLGKLQIFANNAKEVGSVGYAYAEVDASVSGNVVEDSMTQANIAKLGTFANNASSLKDIGFAYAEVQADARGNVIDGKDGNITQAGIARLEPFAKGASSLKDIGFVYAEVQADASGNVIEDVDGGITQAGIARLEPFANGATLLKDVGFVYAEVQASASGNVIENGDNGITQAGIAKLETFANGASLLKDTGFIYAEVQASASGNIVGNGDDSVSQTNIAKLETFANGASLLKDIGFVYADVQANVSGNVIEDGDNGVSQTNIAKLETFANGASLLKDIGFVYADVQANVDGNVIEDGDGGVSQTNIAKLETFANGASLLKDVGFVYADVQANASGNIIEDGDSSVSQTNIAKLETFANGASLLKDVGFVYADVFAQAKGNIIEGGDSGVSQTNIAKLESFANGASLLKDVGYVYADVYASASGSIINGDIEPKAFYNLNSFAQSASLLKDVGYIYSDVHAGASGNVVDGNVEPKAFYNLKMFAESASLLKDADGGSVSIYANASGNVLDGDIEPKSFYNLQMFAQSANMLKDTGDMSVSIFANANGNVLDGKIEPKSFYNLQMFAQSANMLKDIDFGEGGINASIIANASGTVLDDSVNPKSFYNLQMFAESAGMLKDIDFGENGIRANITANASGSVITEAVSPKGLNNLQMFAESASMLKDIDFGDKGINADITANASGSVFYGGTKPEALNNLKMFAEGAQLLKDIDFGDDGINANITATANLTNIANNETAINSLKMLADGAKALKDANIGEEGVTATVTVDADLEGLDDSTGIGNITQFATAAQTLQGIDFGEEGIRARIVAVADFEGLDDSTGIGNIVQFATAAQTLQSVNFGDEGINATITATADLTGFDESGGISNIMQFATAAQMLQGMQNVDLEVSATLNGNLYEDGMMMQVAMLNSFATGAQALQGVEGVDCTISASVTEVPDFATTAKLSSFVSAAQGAQGVSNVDISVTTNIDTANIDAVIAKLREVHDSGLFTSYEASINVSANNSLGDGFSGNGTVTVNPDKTDFGEMFTGVARVSPVPTKTDFGQIFTGAARITPSLTQTEFTVTVNKKEAEDGTVATGTAFAGGSVGRAFAHGNWSIGGSGTALAGELGTELVVRDGRFFTVGDQGAEFFQYKPNDIIFNARQTEELFKYGGIKGAQPRGKMLAGGSAFANGNFPSSGRAFPWPETGSGGSDGGWPEASGTTSSSSSSSSSSSQQSGEAAEEFLEKMDWIEVLLERIETRISKLDITANSIFKQWDTRNKAILGKADEIREKITATKDGAERYKQEAESVDLSEEYKQKVRYGLIDIETIRDEKLKEKIDEYKQWWDKYENCLVEHEQALEDLSQTYADLFNNIVSEFEGIISVAEHEKNMLEESISQSEAQGWLTSAKYYEALVDYEKENQKRLETQRKEMMEQLNENVESGAIKVGSEEWVNEINSINEVTLALEQSKTAVLEYGQTIQELEFEQFDLLMDKISRITSESENLIELMSNDKLFDDNGQFTDRGTATAGLRALNYNVYAARIDKYDEEIEKLEKQLASSTSDKYDQDLIKRIEELKDARWEDALAMEGELDAYKDLVEEGINLELDALKELIDKKNEELDSEKELFDYQRKIEESTKNIANLRKQMAAYANDDSEENRSRIQKIKLELEDAEKDLEEQQYDKYIDDQKEMFDTLYEDYEELLNERLDNTDLLLSELIATTNAKSDEIKTTLETEVGNVGIDLSDAMASVWGEQGVDGTVAKYGDGFLNKMTSANTALENIRSGIEDMIDRLDAIANNDANNAYRSNAEKNKSFSANSYATGKKNFSNDEIAWTQDGGREFIIRPSDGAVLTPLAKGDSVLNAVASNNLWNMANSPADFIKENLGLDVSGSITGQNVNASVSQNFEQIVFSMPNVKNYDEMLAQMQKDKNFQRLIDSMGIDQIAGKSSLRKGKSIR